MFKINEENKEIMEFRSKNANLYMNETTDNCFIFSPTDASCMTLTYKDFKGDTHKIEGVLFAFVEDYKNEHR